MSDQTRREVLKSIALSVSLGGMPIEAAQHVHEQVADAKKKTGGPYKPKLFNAHEYKTVQRLAEMIIPADEVSGSALQAGAPEFIDLIASNNEDIATTLVGGIAWLDRTMESRAQALFVEARPEQQVQILDLIAFRKSAGPELAAGARFFDWIRRLTADAFYTSPIGIKDVGYLGNKGMTTFEVPQEAIAYALKRTGL